MKLKKWLKYIDPIADVRIFESNISSEDEPTYEGPLFDVPWSLVEREIGRANEDENKNDEPIFICSHINQYGTELPLIVINVI